MKPAEIDIRSLAPKVRTALEAVSVLAPNEHTLRSVELMAALAQLQADDDVLLAALLIAWHFTAPKERVGIAAEDGLASR